RPWLLSRRRAGLGPGADSAAPRTGGEAPAVTRTAVRVDRGPLGVAGRTVGVGPGTLGRGPGRVDPRARPADAAGLDLRRGPLEEVAAHPGGPINLTLILIAPRAPGVVSQNSGVAARRAESRRGPG